MMHAKEGKDGHRRPVCPLGIVGLEPTHLSSAGRVSPKSM